MEFVKLSEQRVIVDKGIASAEALIWGHVLNVFDNKQMTGNSAYYEKAVVTSKLYV